MTASEAIHHHETQLIQTDRKIYPSRFVNNMNEKWLVEQKGPLNGLEMFDHRERTVEQYNEKYSNVGGKRFLQRYKKDGDGEQHLVLSIYTHLNPHVHKTQQAGEMNFMDSSGTLYLCNNPVYCTVP